MKALRADRLAADLLRYGLLLGLTLWAVFPFYWLVISALKPQFEVFAFPPTLWPSRVSFKFFIDTWKYSSFPMYFFNSVLVCLLTTALSTFLAAMGSYSLARFPSRGTKHLGRLVLMTYMFPRILLVIPLYYMVNALGLIDTRTSLVIAYSTFNLPFALWLLRSYFQTIPSELDEAALVDGANRWQVLTRIVLPLSLPGLATVATFAFVNSWNEFMYASIFISSDTMKTLPVALHSLVSGETMSWGGLLASSTMVTIPTLLFFFVLQRHIVGGLTAGAVKG